MDIYKYNCAQWMSIVSIVYIGRGQQSNKKYRFNKLMNSDWDQ